MSLTGALDGIVGDGITGAVSLLSGDTGQLVIFGVSITILVLLIGAVFMFVQYARGRGGSR